MKYKHYSFDLWLTLIKSNPQFKSERAKYFQQKFNRHKKSIEEVESIFKEVDLSCNHANEIVGNSISSSEMYVMVLYKLGYPLEDISCRDIDSIQNTISELFFKYMPVLYDSNTRATLRKLKSSGCTMSILSNTGFISGMIMRTVLARLDLSNLFSFQLYSNELNCSKPNLSSFLTMLSNVAEYRKPNPVQHSEIVHIGDNKKADSAAEHVGIDYIIINSNNLTIKDIA